MRTALSIVGVVIGAVALVGGCGPSPAQGCEDLADAAATAAQACGEDYDSFRRALIIGAVGGDCDDTKALRDAGLLYDSCIPAIKALSCEDLKAGKLPASCIGQLQH